MSSAVATVAAGAAPTGAGRASSERPAGRGGRDAEGEDEEGGDDPPRCKVLEMGHVVAPVPA